MQVDLSGLHALVTGSTKGTGLAVAQKLAPSGAEVTVNGRKATDVEAAIAKVLAAVTNAKLVAAPGDVAAASGAATIIKAAGEIDILVNDVGIVEIRDAFAIPDEDSLHMFKTKCSAPTAKVKIQTTVSGGDVKTNSVVSLLLAQPPAG
jgi:NAD(P)-dependent dehydrogenase (short-subunit alcohol dehydrogenase family)